MDKLFPIPAESPTNESFAANDDSAECALLALNALIELNTLLSQRIEEETARVLESTHLLIHQAHNAAMGEMIANIAHQWRQSLTSLSLILQNLRYDNQDDLIDAQRLDNYVDRAQLTIEQMSTTIDDFRQFFSHQPPDATFSLRAACERCADLVSATMEAHQIELALRGDEVFIQGKESEFLQILMNLVANAKDAFLERNISPRRIEIQIQAIQTGVMVSVIDNAKGIPTEIIDKIFDPHFSTKSTGSGIGLYMSRNLVEQHFRGFIEADNWQEGARFRLSLPLPPSATLKPGEFSEAPSAQEISHG